MSSKLAALLTFAAVLGVQTRSADAQRPGGNARPQFSVVASGDNVILVDQREGRTWLLAHSPAGGTPAWVPIQRFENPDEAEHWRQEQHAIAEQREREHHEQHQQELRERLEQRRREMVERREEFAERARREREERMRDEREQRGLERDEPDIREREEREQSERPQSDAHKPGEPGVRERLQRLGQQTRRGMVESLEQHRQRLIEQFGEDHPAVRSIGEQIERLSRELKKAAGEPDEPKKDRSDAKRDAGLPEPPPQKKPPQPPEEQPVKEGSSILESIRKEIDAAKRQIDLESIQKKLDAATPAAQLESTRKQIEALKRQVEGLDTLRHKFESLRRLSDAQAEEKLLRDKIDPDQLQIRNLREEIKARLKSLDDSTADYSGRNGKEAEVKQDAEPSTDVEDGSGEPDSPGEEPVSNAADPAEVQ